MYSPNGTQNYITKGWLPGAPQLLSPLTLIGLDQKTKYRKQGKRK